jgi:hypothetical protein
LRFRHGCELYATIDSADKNYPDGSWRRQRILRGLY